MYHIFSQNQFFSCLTRFFKHHGIVNYCRISFKFEKEIHKTQLHWIMRAVCCTYLRISVPCIGIHNLETTLQFYHGYQYANELKFTNLCLICFTQVTTVGNLVMICSMVADIWEHSEIF